MSSAEIPSRPSDTATTPDGPRRIFRIASLPEPVKDNNPTGRTASQVVNAAYRFADAIRRDAAKN